MIIPRPYQSEALASLDDHIRTKETHPCVVIPTGGGKSILIAWAIQSWKQEYPALRVCILAHRKELVAQNSQELIDLDPDYDVGVYSAGLNRKDMDNSITYASIDSIFKKWGSFPAFDLIIIDECQHIPPKGEGKYRAFIQGCMSINPNLKLIGFTATPYRMGMGNICHKDHILNEICYEANVSDLIRDGFLCKLRSKVGDVQPKLDLVKKNSSGDYVLKSLAAAVDQRDIVSKAIHSAMKIIIAETRKSIVFFCVDQAHCERVSVELRKYGIDAPVVTAKTKHHDRDRYAEGFKNGRYKALCNINVYTEGFNAKRVDCIVLLRPTLSKGLFVQMVGRGLRLHPNKTDCLVLDYAGCISKHGPIDCIDAGETKLKGCEECGDIFSLAIRKCPNCGWEIPKKEVERVEAEEREKKMHEAKAAELAILGKTPDLVVVDEVDVYRHKKAGSPDSLRVEYRCGLSVFREWICLDHGGGAEMKARRWWAERFGSKESIAMTVDGALYDMFVGDKIKSVTKSIFVVRNGKHYNVVGHNIIESQMD